MSHLRKVNKFADLRFTELYYPALLFSTDIGYMHAPVVGISSTSYASYSQYRQDSSCMTERRQVETEGKEATIIDVSVMYGTGGGCGAGSSGSKKSIGLLLLQRV